MSTDDIDIQAAEDDNSGWAKLFTNGRTIYYEGDDPEGFRAQIKAEFGFDPGDDPKWGEFVPEEPGTPEGARLYAERQAEHKARIQQLQQAGVPFKAKDYEFSMTKEEWESVPVPAYTNYAFLCPPEHLNAIYGSRRFPMGS